MTKEELIKKWRKEAKRLTKTAKTLYPKSYRLIRLASANMLEKCAKELEE